MTFPTFLIIGAARSGTTSLYEYASQHPKVFVSRIKEPNYFAVAGQPVHHRGPGEERLRWITTAADYTRLFADARHEDATGEASPLYLYSPRAPGQICHSIPEARLVAILRDPVERAYSAFSYLRERGSEPLARFEDALDAEDERVSEGWSHIWHYRRMGFYHEQLSRYYELFPAEQIRVFLYEELAADPGRVMRDVFDHIGVDPAFSLRPSGRRNVSGEARYRALAPLLQPNRVTVRARPLLGRTFGQLAGRLKERVLVKPPLPEPAARRLRELFEDDVRNLSALLERDLDGWLEH